MIEQIIIAALNLFYMQVVSMNKISVEIIFFARKGIIKIFKSASRRRFLVLFHNSVTRKFREGALEGNS